MQHGKDGFAIEAIADWTAFKKRLSKRYLHVSDVSRRELILFRGQNSASWGLTPTIDRLGTPFRSDEDREIVLNNLVNCFKQNSYGIRDRVEQPERPEHWEYLGRHHGLPTTILDWTQSPYVAAYFAFENRPESEFVSVWVLECGAVDFSQMDDVALDDDPETLKFNLRAAEQRGVSMRVLTGQQPLESMLGPALRRLDIPGSERESALRDLDEMLINARTLFRDLDGAAKLAMLRLGYAYDQRE